MQAILLKERVLLLGVLTWIGLRLGRPNWAVFY
jgi:hypothetical protein